MMEITLQVDGREFSLEEVEAILKEYLSKEKTKQEPKIIIKPTEGVPFEVNPLGIDRTIFQEERNDPRQERTRYFIREAFKNLDKKPKKYGKPFKTLMPQKNWDVKTFSELKDLASHIGDHMADWVEQSLEWAQRLSNGETWEDVCNNVDSAKWYRLVKGMHGYIRIVGGSLERCYGDPAANVFGGTPSRDEFLGFTVPLVVLYE